MEIGNSVDHSLYIHVRELKMRLGYGYKIPKSYLQGPGPLPQTILWEEVNRLVVPIRCIMRWK